VRDAGQSDNTLIIYISGDNGGSAEGQLRGTPNEFAFFNGVEIPVERQLPFLEAWGDETTHPNLAVGWTWAFSTPYRWTKQVASHFGGTRNGMAISWPRRITDRGGIRHQFHHVSDIAPTLLEATGIPEPRAINRVAQRPIEGLSLAYMRPYSKDLRERAVQRAEAGETIREIAAASSPFSLRASDTSIPSYFERHV